MRNRTANPKLFATFSKPTPLHANIASFDLELKLEVAYHQSDQTSEWSGGGLVVWSRSQNLLFSYCWIC
jgi:hypothetical protein